MTSNKIRSSQIFWLIVILGVIAIIFGGIWCWSNENPVDEVSQTGKETVKPAAAIKNDTDLDKIASELDKTNIDSLDASLGQNDKDMSQF